MAEDDGNKTEQPTAKRLSEAGFDTVGSSSASFRSYLAQEITKWAKVVKASGAKVD